MPTLALAREQIKARKDKKINEFTGEVRSIENEGLEEGDVLVFPQNYDDIYERKFGTATAQYFLCQLDGTDMVKPFYPSTFTKSRTIYDEDGNSTGTRVHTMGTAAKLFRTFGSVKEAMDALKGKKVKVTKIDTIRSWNIARKEVANAQIPTLDLVED